MNVEELKELHELDLNNKEHHEIKTWPLENITPQELLDKALEASKFAYVPHSHFHVGAALIFKDGEIINGCNIENASFGLTICAERTAVANMISHGLKDKNPVAIAVVGSPEDTDDYLKVPCPPCGMCRQTLMEFAPDLLVVLASHEGPKVYKLKDLLPFSFNL